MNNYHFLTENITPIKALKKCSDSHSDNDYNNSKQMGHTNALQNLFSQKKPSRIINRPNQHMNDSGRREEAHLENQHNQNVDRVRRRFLTDSVKLNKNNEQAIIRGSRLLIKQLQEQIERKNVKIRNLNQKNKLLKQAKKGKSDKKLKSLNNQRQRLEINRANIFKSVKKTNPAKIKTQTRLDEKIQQLKLTRLDQNLIKTESFLDREKVKKKKILKGYNILKQLDKLQGMQYPNLKDDEVKVPRKKSKNSIKLNKQ